MIINQSRIKTFQRCQQLAHFEYERRLMVPSKAEALVTGTAAHEGFATLLSGRSVAESKLTANKSFDMQLDGEWLLPEEQQLYEQRKAFVHKAIEKYAANLPKEGFQVLHPEVKFRVAIPNTEHYCYYFWKAEHPTGTYENFLDAPVEQRYYKPIYYQGKTDAVVVAQGMIWLLEHKTSSDYRQTFWDNFLLDMQITGYIYGIWKSLGIRPSGAIINKLQKPNKRQSIEATDVTSEAYLRSDEQVQYFETWITRAATLYEHIMPNRLHFFNTASCYDWNRACTFHDICKEANPDTLNGNSDEGLADRFIARPSDYVEESYLEILKQEDAACQNTRQ